MDNAQPFRQPTPVYDTLEAQRQNYNLAQGQKVSSSLAAKQAMQQLYKNQLDRLMQEKQRQKEYDRQRAISQKREFNQRTQQGKQAERMKQISYKNYYSMLMNNQNQNIEMLASHPSKRDAMKDNLIEQNIEDESRRYRQFDIEARRREQERKNTYRNELLGQIDERRKREYVSRNNLEKEKEEFQLYAKGPQEIRRYQKERRKDQTDKYRGDLDRLVVEGKERSQSQNEAGITKGGIQIHNILTNPLPFNIQNPYILKQMGVPKNQSYLAMKGSQNLKLS